jgi:hypothetical protein
MEQNLLEQPTIQIDTPKCIIQNIFDFDIMRDDLREWIFKEDEIGRYRERIWAKIEEFGVEKWFKAKGYPTEKTSVWKNRYCGTLTTMEEENKGNCATNEDSSLENKGYILWENYLPEALWNDKELSLSYRVGTKEYFDRIKEEEAHEKKYSKGKKPKAQNTLFDKENSSLAEESEDLDEDESEFQDEEQDEEVEKDYSKMTTLEKMEEHNKRLLNEIMTNDLNTGHTLRN